MTDTPLEVFNDDPDPRLAFLQRAAARCTLVELGQLSLDEGFDELIEPFMAIVNPPECRICGTAPCRTPSFCEACEEADRRKQNRAAAEQLRFLRSLNDGVSLETAYRRIFERRRQYQRQHLLPEVT